MSSLQVVADAVQAVGKAASAGDRDELRFALEALATEAGTLASMEELLPTPIGNRQRIAVETDGDKR